MRKTVVYSHCFFDEKIIREVLDVLRKEVAGGTDSDIEDNYSNLFVKGFRESWDFCSVDEFLSGLADSYGTPDFDWAMMTFETATDSDPKDRGIFELHQYRNKARVSIRHKDRRVIERVHGVFRSHETESFNTNVYASELQDKIPRIFIGHGGKSQAWRNLKDQLHDKHGYEVVAYETGARAGHSIRDILEDLLTATDFAILVFTAEDEQISGEMHARQNVIHEAGLFQGKLGFPRAIIVKDATTELFSNVDGVQYVSFNHDISETYGDILATVRREFEK